MQQQGPWDPLPCALCHQWSGAGRVPLELGQFPTQALHQVPVTPGYKALYSPIPLVPRLGDLGL